MHCPCNACQSYGLVKRRSAANGCTVECKSEICGRVFLDSSKPSFPTLVASLICGCSLISVYPLWKSRPAIMAMSAKGLIGMNDDYDGHSRIIRPMADLRSIDVLSWMAWSMCLDFSMVFSSARLNLEWRSTRADRMPIWQLTNNGAKLHLLRALR